jgi:hypothetical protein
MEASQGLNSIDMSLLAAVQVTMSATEITRRLSGTVAGTVSPGLSRLSKGMVTLGAAISRTSSTSSSASRLSGKHDADRGFADPGSIPSISETSTEDLVRNTGVGDEHDQPGDEDGTARALEHVVRHANTDPINDPRQAADLVDEGIAEPVNEPQAEDCVDEAVEAGDAFPVDQGGEAAYSGRSYRAKAKRRNLMSASTTTL